MSDAAEFDAKLATMGDWRGAALARVRRLIREFMQDQAPAAAPKAPARHAAAPRKAAAKPPARKTPAPRKTR